VDGPCGEAAAEAPASPKGLKTAGVAAVASRETEAAAAAAAAARRAHLQEAKEWRRYSCTALPKWAPLQDGLTGFFRELPKVMRGRTLVLVGDSVTALTYVDLVWSLTYFAKRSSRSNKQAPNIDAYSQRGDATTVEGASGIGSGSEKGNRESEGRGTGTGVNQRKDYLSSVPNNEDVSMTLLPEASTSRVSGGPLCHTWKAYGFSICLQQVRAMIFFALSCALRKMITHPPSQSFLSTFELFYELFEARY